MRQKITDDEFDETEPNGTEIEIEQTIIKKGDLISKVIGEKPETIEDEGSSGFPITTKMKFTLVEGYKQKGNTENGYMLHFEGSKQKYEMLKEILDKAVDDKI